MRHLRPRTVPRPWRLLRHRLRHPRWYWLAAAALTGVTASLVWQFLATAEAGARRYGDPTETLVALAPVRAGTRLGDAPVELRRLPATGRPEGALDGRPADAVVRLDLGTGEVVTTRHLARPGAGPVATRVGAGRRAVAIDRGQHPLPLEIGDRVDVVAATGDPSLPGTGAADTLATDAEVVAVDDRVVTVAVRTATAAAVAAAAQSGSVAVVLVGSSAGDP